MNERFTLEYTVTEITENERVSRKLPFFFDMALCEQLKWPFRKMKLKHMMKLVRFPAQELVTAANFILERREAGEKISIPVWRDLPEAQSEAAKDVVLIPYVTKGTTLPAVLICPDLAAERLNMVKEGMPAAKELQELGCAAFILNYRKDGASADMGRAIRFLRANHQKLGIDPERIALLACGSACTGAEELNRLRENIEDVTHRYDGIRPYPDGTWTDHDSGGLEHERLAQFVRELKDGKKE